MLQKVQAGEILFKKYEVLNLIGEGAFGSVYRAKDLKLERHVAIKVVNSAQGVMQRFLSEIDAIKKLEHPNIVKLYDYDLLPGGVPCLIMEYIKGRELGDILTREGSFSYQKIGEIALQVLDALVETHKLGIIHCDLKPENIMLTSVGARSDVVKLIDFGVASIMSHSQGLTSSGKSLVGTPQYMAPEQIHRKNMGAWTDVYALGLILIELSTGRFVFDASDPREVLRMQLYEPVVIPHELAKSELGLCIAKAVTKDYRERYQSSQEFYEDMKLAVESMKTAEIWARKRSKLESLPPRQHAAPSIFEYFSESELPEAVAQKKLQNVLKTADHEAVRVFPKRSSLEIESLSSDELDKLNLSLHQKGTTLNLEVRGETPTLRRVPSLQESLSRQQELREQDSEQKRQAKRNTTKGLIFFAAAFAIVLMAVGMIYAREQGYWGKGEEKPLAVKQNAEKKAVQAPVRRATLERLSLEMSYAAYMSAYMSMRQEADFAFYQIVGAPVDASLYINKSLVCIKTPCRALLYGDRDSIELELRSGQHRALMRLSEHSDAEKPIFLSTH